MDRWSSWGRGTLTKLLLVGLALAVTAGVAVAATSSGSKKQSVSSAVAKGLALAAKSGDRAGNGTGSSVQVGHSAKNDTSPKLRNITPKPVTPASSHQAIKTPPIVHQHTNRRDSAVQTRMPAKNMPAPGLSFDGIPFPGVNCNCAPPDTNGEVGSTQYVQIVNEGLQVFDKSTGSSLLGPIGIATLWSGFGGVCETNGEGDPVVLYDQLANRWVSPSSRAPPSRPRVRRRLDHQRRDGAYNRYDFDLGPFGNNFYDYPKLGGVA